SSHAHRFALDCVGNNRTRCRRMGTGARWPTYNRNGVIMYLGDTAIPGHVTEGRISTMPEPDGQLFVPTTAQRAAVKKPPKRTYQQYYDYFRNTMGYHHEHSDREAKRFVELQKFWGHGVHLNPD